jgi:NAD kinase
VATNAPRAVFVTRETDYERLLARHATRDQVRFFLKTRGQSMDDVETRHDHFYQVLKGVRAVVPADWRSTLVHRADLDRFLFAPGDLVVAVGQDGLVANVAKYLDGQPVLGVNPDPAHYDGILVPLAPDRVAGLLRPAAHGDVTLQRRTMIEAALDDGQKLLGLNEIFVGHRSHQSARYDIEVGGERETQSSSGLIVSSGTGATGWAHSMMDAMQVQLTLRPDEDALAFFVREAFASVATATSIRAGKIEGNQPIRVISRMNDGGVIFADGIEHDFLGFDWGRTTRVSISSRHLNLVMPASSRR